MLYITELKNMLGEADLKDFFAKLIKPPSQQNTVLM